MDICIYDFFTFNVRIETTRDYGVYRCVTFCIVVMTILKYVNDVLDLPRKQTTFFEHFRNVPNDFLILITFIIVARVNDQCLTFLVAM